ncbi:MAG: penicillin-binding protein 2 [Campylobacterales bacterium]
MRLYLVLGLIILVWLILLSRLYFLSIKSNRYYEEMAQRNAIKTEVVFPVRGMIFDRNKTPLAINKIGFSISFMPHLSPKKRLSELHAESELLAKLFGVNAAELRKRYLQVDSPYNHDPIPVIDFLTYEVMLPHYAMLNQRTNLILRPATKREYPNGTTASHLIGYVAKATQDEIEKNPLLKQLGVTGKAGIEKYYDKELQGRPGMRMFYVNAQNQEVAQISNSEPSRNQDLILSIDLKLQQTIDKLFADKMGAAIVMDLHDGSIIAAGSYPEYNNSAFAQRISQSEWEKLINDPHHPLTNKLIRGLYPPGSTVKPGVALAFLEEGKFDEYFSIVDRGYLIFGGRKFRDWKKEGHGNVNLRKAIAQSCDTYFYYGASIVGIGAIAKILGKFGFGQQTGIDLPGESKGILPTPEWKKRRWKQAWYLGDTLNTAIGQGNFIATPIQVAVYTAIVATGKRVRPHLAMSIAGQPVKPQIFDELTIREKQLLAPIREGMYAACNVPGGTVYAQLSHMPVTIAGKTGTAQVVGISQSAKTRVKESEYAYFQRSHAWLTTYAPYEKPRYVVTVLVEHGGHGGEAAGPLVREIYYKLHELGYFNEHQNGQSNLPEGPAS